MTGTKNWTGHIVRGDGPFKYGTEGNMVGKRPGERPREEIK